MLPCLCRELHTLPRVHQEVRGPHVSRQNHRLSRQLAWHKPQTWGMYKHHSVAKVGVFYSKPETLSFEDSSLQPCKPESPEVTAGVETTAGADMYL